MNNLIKQFVLNYRQGIDNILCGFGLHDWRNMDGVCSNPHCRYRDPLWYND